MRVSTPVTLPDGRIVRGRFDATTIALHWTSVVLVLLQLGSGWAMSGFGALATWPFLLLYHRSAGTLVLFVTLTRLCWRRFAATFPPFPTDLSRVTKWVARASEYALYTMLLLQPATGLAYTLLRGRPIPIFMTSLPALLPRNPQLSEQFHQFHILGAKLFAGLVGLHAAAALMHHLLLRDDVLEMMAPALRRRPAQRDLRNELFDVPN